MAMRLPLLVVDDREADRQLMILTLAVAFPEAEVLVAVDPHEALRMCDAQDFECVLTDYEMGDMNGVAMAFQLRAAHPHLPIVLMTSVGDEMLAVEAMRNGVSDYIPKSRITAESVRRIVDRSIHGCAQQRLIDQQRDELETFAYALAHDFKQPIRQITIFSEMIAEQLAGQDVGDVQQHLTFLQGAAGRLAKLVDIMSQYTLLNQPPELGKVDLNVVIASVSASLGPYLADRGADFVFPHDAPTVRGNETLMTQVVQNLVMNGLHYNRSVPPRVELIARDAPEGCVIEIVDNGIGIDTEYLGEIFKPLVRLHNSSEFPGSGLGLALTKRAVLSQGGEIWCESEPDRGSSFFVRLPAAAAEPVRSAAA
jgi:signal transduction histidine kinase